MSERAQPNRWRCLAVGCNPKLDETKAAAHARESGHRVARWPVRSAAGKRKAKARNRSGYYDRYNVGAKSAEARGLVSSDHGFDGGPLAEGEDGTDYWGDSVGG